MNVSLRALQGKLQSRKGRELGMVIHVHHDPFVIGSGSQANLRCVSSSISETHCQLEQTASGLVVRDLKSGSGTYVNDHRVASTAPLRNGDQLRVGKLSFEVVLNQEVGVRDKRADAVGDFVSDLLSSADEADRQRRLEEPGLRTFQFQPETVEEPQVTAEDQKEASKKFVRPPKRPPAKLPPPPPFVADNTVQAAEEILKKMFEK
jgi:predicted component of type VI protein secretion system